MEAQKNISIVGSSCVGCAACATACGFGAVSMVSDGLGFLVPAVEAKKCVECGRCVRACPIESKRERIQPLEVLIAKSASNDKRRSSPSGAVFTELAEDVIKGGGVVYGAAWNDDFSVSHHRATTLNELDALRGSKYVQSNLIGIWHHLQNDLRCGRQVLFSGTPCQVAAVYSSLGRDYENLITVAIMCHSVTSPDTWKWYLEDVSSRSRSRIVGVNFRDKRDGLAGHLMSVSFEDDRETIVTSLDDNPYAKVFFNLLNTRESCFDCKFKGNSCGADLVIGDFWGGQKHHPDFDDGHGVNAVLILSQRGKELISHARGIVVILSGYEKVLERNPLIERSVRPNVIQSNRFKSVYRRIRFYKAVDYAMKGSVLHRTCHKFKTAARLILKAFGWAA